MLRDDPEIIKKRRELGERIGDLRAAAHHTQDSLCNATGISRSQLQRIEAGEADIRYSELLAIASAVNAEVSALGIIWPPTAR
ncbi:helix-turn-helix domain-containing protein [Streptomyces antibioticus]|uniref:helix-turn-helix domain-containing protein n=1 Tax=Streptomyces antibioticus TaxID=1890 RepID=UPI0036C1C891